jgi:hypothetical protein
MGETKVEVRMVVRVAVNFTSSAIYQFVTHRMMYSHALPYSAVRLLDPNVAVREECLEWCKVAHDKWEVLEASSCAGHDAAAYRNAMIWPRLTWPCEMLLELKGVDFRGTPKSVGEPLQDFATGWGASKIIEDGNRVEKSCKSLSQSGKYGVDEFMHQLISSPLLEEFDRPPIDIDRMSPEMRKKIRERNHTLSKGSLGSTSLEEEKLFSLSLPSFETCNAEAWRMQGCVTATVMASGPLLEGLDLSWMARMLRRGTMIQRVGLPHVFMVCGATSSGVIGLKLKPCAVPLKNGEIHRF